MTVDADTDALAARDLLVSAAREAGAVALEYFNPGARTSARVVTKAGGSPVTDADLAADSLLKRRLQEALPDAGWLSEETVDDFERLSRRCLIIVDPIDGTRGLMYQKRPAWILTGVARGPGPCTLADIELAVQTEIPLVKQHLSDTLWAVRGQSASAARVNRFTGDIVPLMLHPSTATTTAWVP